jgi:ankyrin repeat protein
MGASAMGHQACVEALIRGGARVGDMTRGFTALHMAASGGHPECVEALLRAGADRNARLTILGRAWPVCLGGGTALDVAKGEAVRRQLQG